MVDELTTVAPAIAVGLRADALEFAWQARPVLRGVDLELPVGTVIALRGANGSGKTTLLRLLAGLLEPDAGSVRLGALDAIADRRAYMRRVGLATAGDRGLYARLDVRANLQLAAGLALVPARRSRELIAAALERFELGELARRRCDRLSLGQRQRLRLSIAFLHGPDVVLLDEPTSSLDADGTALLARALGELTARGASALWAAPDGPPPALPADRVRVLVDGRLEEGA
jgi:ABC-type multidrug transport system ATPase subunit